MVRVFMQEVSAKYWPNKGDTMEVGKFTIENTNETTYDKYFVRRMMKVSPTTVINLVALNATVTILLE